jgi:cephalosporin hydroxylase
MEEKYKELCNTPSDINQHLPKLREYADRCDHITEMGVRGCVSLYAFLSSKASKVVAIDILNVWTPKVDKLKFICANDLEIEIEQTDFLFIDTVHNYKHLIQELNLHADKVNKYIGFHDTDIFGLNGDDGGRGLLFAIEEFLYNHPEWVMDYKVNFNNGLTIIRRK